MIGVGPPVEVERIEVRRVEVPLVAPLAAAHDTQVVRGSVLIAATDGDGRTGWGECAALARPTYTSEWIDGAWLVLTDLLVPAVLAGREVSVVGHPMATAALECALIDLELQAADRSLRHLLGAADTVQSRAVVGLRTDPDELVAVVASRLAVGHRSVKVKVTPGTADRDLAAVRGTWPGLDLAVDANGSFDLDRHADELRALDGWGLAYVEQPLRADDLLGHAQLRRQWTTPVALDESIAGVGELRAAHALAALDLVNVKPARVGGIRAVGEVLATMLDIGIEGFCGGMYELGVGRAVALAVAGSSPLCDQPTDLGPSDAYVPRDLTSPHILDSDGTIAVPDRAGIGRRPDPDAVEAFTVAVTEQCR